MTLRTELEKADAIDIDGVFIRYFSIESDGGLDISLNADGIDHSWEISAAQIDAATRSEDGSAWRINDQDGNEEVQIQTFEVRPLTAIPALTPEAA